MINAIALVQAATDRITRLGQALAELSGVTEVYSFAGKEADLIAIIRVTEPEELAEITNHISNINGVLNTNAHVAFRHYPRADIQAGFSIGFEPGRPAK